MRKVQYVGPRLVPSLYYRETSQLLILNIQNNFVKGINSASVDLEGYLNKKWTHLKMSVHFDYFFHREASVTLEVSKINKL